MRTWTYIAIGIERSNALYPFPMPTTDFEELHSILKIYHSHVTNKRYFEMAKKLRLNIVDGAMPVNRELEVEAEIYAVNFTVKGTATVKYIAGEPGCGKGAIEIKLPWNFAHLMGDVSMSSTFYEVRELALAFGDEIKLNRTLPVFNSKSRTLSSEVMDYNIKGQS